MPACVACRRPALSARWAPKSLYRSISAATFTFRHRTSLNNARYSSTDTNSSSTSSTGTTEISTLRHETLTLLYKTTALLPRLIPFQGQSPNALGFWNRLLAEAYDDLNLSGETNARIVVYGVDEWSGASDLVTALLEEPFTSDDTQNEAVRNRWMDHSKGDVTIQHGMTTTIKESTIEVPSSFLHRFPIPVQITEMAPTPHTSSGSPQAPPARILGIPDDSNTFTLFKADIPIILCNPLTTPLHALLTSVLPIINPNAILILTSISPPLHTSAQTNLFTKHVPSISKAQMGIEPEKLKFLFIDPARAIQGLRALSSHSKSTVSIQKYQDDFIGSRISTLTDALKAIFTSSYPSRSTTSSNSRSMSIALRTNTTLANIQCTLSVCRVSLQRAKVEIDIAHAGISELKSKVQGAKERVQDEVLSVSKQNGTSKSTANGGVVDKALKDAGKEMTLVMDRLSWYRMLWRVDEVGRIVGNAVERAYGRELETELILHTGRLSALQQNLTSSTLTLLSTLAFTSPLLYNTLLQLSSSPSYPLTPLTLTSPLHTRRSQIIDYPTTRLHLAGQSALLGVSGGLAAGVGVGWAVWVGWLTGSGEGILGFLGTNASTSIGIGVLGALAGVRWAVGKWEREKRRWWEDWDRVGEGLERDLKVALDQTMQANVVIVADRACSGLLAMVKKREEEIAKIEVELEGLQEELRKVKERTRMR